MLRKIRGYLYRCFPAASRSLFRKKISGYERRWELETKGFTKEGFFQVFSKKILSKYPAGFMFELCAGDGVVGSLALWLEKFSQGWQVQAWEARPLVFAQLRKNRPRTKVHLGRLTDWAALPSSSKPSALTARGAREASAACRAIRLSLIQPFWLGIWNPSRRPIWHTRLRRQGYRLAMVWQNNEIYVKA